MNTDAASPFFSTPEMDRVFSLANQLKLMMRFERALSAALEESGLASAGSAVAMDDLLDAEFVDWASLLAEAAHAGNLAIPFVRQLTKTVRERNEDAARAIHLGATSQDVLDTALVLQAREALEWVEPKIDELAQCLTAQALAHAGTLLAGRTWLQKGPPTTLGLKIAGWVAALRRHKERLRVARERAVSLQFGGAVGTLAVLGEKGAAVSSALARTLELPEPELPWHTHRDGLVEVACALAMLVGTLGKMARDVGLLMQTEVGELFEPAGECRGGSSTMPHKRNPVASAAILAASTRMPGLVATMLAAMVQEHERGLGNWQAEWEIYPQIFKLTSAALERAIEIAKGMEVCPERMAANLEATRGVTMAEAVSAALAARVGRGRAHELMKQASQRALAENLHLRDVLLATPEVREHLTEEDIGGLLDARNYLGSARRFVRRVIGEDDATS
jgi:3-carboxy-cis,cis-muconate cycloisomerase